MRCEGLPAGAKLLLAAVASTAAFAARTPTALAALGLCEAGLLVLFRVRPAALLRDLRVLVWQTALIVALYALRFGFPQGLVPGLLTSGQIFLAFLPGAAVLQSTPPSRIARAVGRVLPATTAFVLATSLRFLPLLVSEIRAIYEAQVLRGARILPRDLWKPRCWGDLVNTLLVPAAVHAMALAGDIALAARARHFGAAHRRTYWPGP